MNNIQKKINNNNNKKKIKDYYKKYVISPKEKIHKRKF